MPKKKFDRSIRAGKRLQIARYLYGFDSRDELNESDLWKENIVRHKASTLIKDWETNGIPEPKLCKVANCFNLETYLFTDDKIDDHYFRRVLEIRKNDSYARLPEYPYQRQNPDETGPMASKQKIIDFQNYMNTKTNPFFGRKKAFQKIKKFLKSNSKKSGYLLIEGEPGTGKSSFLSKLVLKHDYIHHFNRSTVGITKPEQFIRNICAQLIGNYKLTDIIWPDTGDQDGLFLEQLLFNCSELLKNDEKIIITIDALDEVNHNITSTHNNVLFLPESLPDNVYFIVTSRQKWEHRLRVSQVNTYKFDESETREDIESFIKFHLDNFEVFKQIRSWKLSQKDFITLMIEKSECNFMYLYYVLHAITNGDFNHKNPNKIPLGLKQYYRDHWEEMRSKSKEKFEKVYEPVICMLAAVPEAVTVKQIANYTELREFEVKQVIKKLYTYLTEIMEDESTSKYRLYHKSFQDYLKSEVDIEFFKSKTKINDFYDRLAGI